MNLFSEEAGKKSRLMKIQSYFTSKNFLASFFIEHCLKAQQELMPELLSLVHVACIQNCINLKDTQTKFTQNKVQLILNVSIKIQFTLS